jgi:hypothetical protein
MTTQRKRDIYGRRLRKAIERVRRLPANEQRAAAFTGNCPIREHTGDGHYVGRCEFATYGGFCPRHGALADYPNRDDREVAIVDRRGPESAA